MAAPWSAGAEVRIIGEMHGSQVVNVFHLATNTVINDDAGRNNLLLQLAIAMLACAVDTLLPAVSSDYTLKSVNARSVHPVPSDEQIAVAEAGAVGQLSPSSTSFISSLINVKTGGGGRRGRGKKFLPPPGETEILNSEMDDPTLNLIFAFIGCVVAKFVGAGATTVWRFGILSHANLKAAGGTFDNSFREATQLVPSKTLAIMGSRKKGVGA